MLCRWHPDLTSSAPIPLLRNYISLFCFVFFKRGSHYVALASLEFTTLLPELPQCQDYSYFSQFYWSASHPVVTNSLHFRMTTAYYWCHAPCLECPNACSERTLLITTKIIEIFPFYPAAITCLHYTKCFSQNMWFNSHDNSIGQRYVCSQSEENPPAGWYLM